LYVTNSKHFAHELDKNITYYPGGYIL
jgi:hypothetical protein